MSLTLRPAATSDLAGIFAIERRVEEHDRLPLRTPFEEFEEWLHDPDLDLERDTRVAEVGGVLAGWARIWHRPSREREHRAYLFGGVDPAHRGCGVGSTLLRWEIERATEILRSSPVVLPRFVRAQTYDFDHARLRLYRRHGLAPARYNDELLCPLDTAAAAPDPAGITIVPWDVSRSDEARGVQNDSFADHWGSSPLDAASWEHILRAAGTRLDLSFMAFDGARMVGVCRNDHFPDDEALSGRREGWIFQVGVLRSHRKRGIASALIAASIAAFRGAGFTHAALAVDSENPTGAYSLYQRLGFEPVRRSVVHQLEA